MNCKVFVVLLILLAAGALQSVLAQERPSGRPQTGNLPPALQSRLTQGDRLTRFRLHDVANERLDRDAGIVRAMYRIEAVAGRPGAPEQAAGAFLASQAGRLGIAGHLDDLVIESIESGRYSSHITYRQTYRGLPVYNRRLKLNLDREGRPTLLLNGVAPVLFQDRALNVDPTLSARNALDLLANLFDQADVRSSDPELVVYPEAPARLAWRLFAWPEQPALELEILIDAHSGSILAVQNTSADLKGSAASVSLDVDPPAAQRAASGIALAPVRPQGDLLRRASGTGFVFDPDPLTSAGRAYGPPFTDQNDADIPEVNAQRIEVDLLDISRGADQLYRLEGPYVQIVPESSGGTSIYTPPAESSPDGFHYTRSNEYFEAVNVYYHIDKSQRYVQALDVGHDIQNLPLRVNPHGLGLEDNSRYFSAQNYIAFGAGGVDDAEDAHVIWHEYGHALLQASAPGLLNSIEGQALHEGWADYWAASYARSLVENGRAARTDWRTLFKWDSGDGTIWAGRSLDFAGKYPEDTFCDEGSFRCDIYDDGLLWAATLMQIYDVLGRTVTDRLNLASHAYLMHPVTFRDAAEAVIQADADLYGGAHIDFLIQTFNARGLIDLAAFGPFAVHEALTATEQLGGGIPISVEATGISAPIEHVRVVYTHPGGVADTLDLLPAGGNAYTGTLPLPSSAGTLTYYIDVSDQLGLSVRLPSGAAGATYSFYAGPDLTPPTISHTGLESTALVDWPALLVSTVEDDLGVDTVVVSYFIEGPQGNRLAEGDFGLTLEANRYKGVFPAPIDVLEPGSTVFYSIRARDRALAGNEARLPETDFFAFDIYIDNGVFRQYNFDRDFEIVGLTATGSWQRGIPAYGLRTAHSKKYAWATNPASSYPAIAQVSTLELPPLNLNGFEQAYLVFWHWYDTEHDGEATPESSPAAVLWDGGNVKISTDDGASWALLQPEGGYNGAIASGRENPLGGEAAFGGYSYGWRQAVARLPGGTTVRIRFDFGTDHGNDAQAISFAGWYLDDISILTDRPEDVAEPEVVLFPPAVSVRDAGQPTPKVTIEAIDDTGIASAFVDFRVYSAGHEEQGRFRLAMDSLEIKQFSGAFPLAAAKFAVGDSVTYRVVLADFAGNGATYPASGSSPYRIEYRLRDRIDLLAGAVPSGNWKWVDGHWVVTRSETPRTLSSLVFGPFDLPRNVDNLQLLLSHQQELLAISDQPDDTVFAIHGGNVKIATGSASSWQVLRPIDGYNGRFAMDPSFPNPLANQDVFTDSRPYRQQAMFDLLDRKGEQIWLRIDFAAPSELTDSEFWKIEEAALVYSTLKAENGGFDFSRAFSLHENFPDPFSATTTLSYTLPEATRVRLEVYDILGRRVASLVDREQSAGTYTLTFDGSSLASGLYLLRMTTEAHQAVERMIVAR